MTPFWEKAMKCKHVWNPNYYASGACWTDYCSWTEQHCLVCGVYSVTCGCRANNGMSGWPFRRIMHEIESR